MDPLQVAIDKCSRELLPTAARVFTFIYLVIALAHILILPDELVSLMAGVAVFSLLVGICLQFSIENELVEKYAELVLVFLIILMGLNSILHMYLSGDVKQTTNFVFVMAVSGYALPGSRTFYPTVVGLLGSWLILVVAGFDWNAETTHFGFEILLGAMFALFLHSVRRNQLLQMTNLESTIDRLGESQNQVVARESLMQSLIDNIPAGIVVLSKDRRVLYMNVEAKKTLGVEDRVELGDRVDRQMFKLYHKSGRALDQSEAPVTRVLDSGEPVRNEIVGALLPDGEMSWGLVNAFLLDLQLTGESVVVVASTNITERVKVEMQLLESETRARTILDSIEEGVISVDKEKLVTSFNPSAQQLTGYDESQGIGRPLDAIFQYVDSADDTEDGFQFIRDGVLTNANGSEVAVDFRDVSEQLRLEQERATMDKMSSVGVLAGGIAHDFNNLLTAIYGNIALAESVIDDPDKARGFLQRSAESIQLATNLTTQLLTFATGSDPVRDVVDVEKLVREATRFSLSGSSIAVTFSIDPDVNAVEVDDGQMRQAISNIVLNAKQAMGDVGCIRIEIANVVPDNERPGEFVEVRISDDGPGIEQELQSRIFDPYFTTKDTGNGLGLATTHSIIVKHGGFINVESSAEEGTSFSILLPSAGPRIATGETGVTAERGSLNGLEILIMDDEDIVLQTISMLLEHLGHKVTGTSDGSEAIAVYARKMQQGERFDLVIMDLTVAGGMGGRVAAGEILGIDPQARLVVSSGYSAGAEMARYKELGFCARLEKPFSSADLESMISEVMSPPLH
jgi:PAS domain S-box-containing protein